jgi:hypothetical protein
MPFGQSVTHPLPFNKRMIVAQRHHRKRAAPTSSLTRAQPCRPQRGELLATLAELVAQPLQRAGGLKSREQELSPGLKASRLV